MQKTVVLDQACDHLGEAVANGDMGEIVAKHEKMILGYYEDVKEQANKSFSIAKTSAILGFAVIVFSLAYLLVWDTIVRVWPGNFPGSKAAMGISQMSLISGAIIEVISAVTFVLYARGAKQFGAFHICLERTHRYLLAFKIAEQTGKERDRVLGSLVCIMANAPMISQGKESPQRATGTTIQPPNLFATDAGVALPVTS